MLTERDLMTKTESFVRPYQSKQHSKLFKSPVRLDLADLALVGWLHPTPLTKANHWKQFMTKAEDKGSHHHQKPLGESAGC